jgi:hypothetical protein
MKTALVPLLAFALSIPAAAQNATPIFSPTAARAVLNSPDVREGLEALKTSARLRDRPLRRLGFEDGGVCVAPVPISGTDIDMHRSLFVHDAATLTAGNFSLRRTLTKLRDDVSGSVVGQTPESIFRQFLDSQNDAANAQTTGNALCSDNNGKINGYPLNTCPRPEGLEASGTFVDIANRIDNDYKPIALVNRIDLADKGWKNCGEHRIVYGKSVSGSKNFFIFEGVLPNPRPGCRSGCRAVLEFWVDLSTDVSPSSRAAKLENFFFNGITGFEPVIKSTHYTSGTSSAYGGSASGQIRTNQFLSGRGGTGPWTLKEFKTLLSCAGGRCDFDILPTAPKVNPYGVLWDRDVATGTVPPLPRENRVATPIAGLAALAAAFQGEVAAQVTAARLGNPDINSISYEVAHNKNSAESQSGLDLSQQIDFYGRNFALASDATFRSRLDTLAAGVGLTGRQIVNRATANSCAGCHRPGFFGLTSPNDIGPGMSWPLALAFVHVDANTVSLAAMPDFDPANFGGNVNGSNISPALLDVFLPARKSNLTSVANQDVCDCLPAASALAPRPRPTRIVKLSIDSIRSDIAAVDKRFADPASGRVADPRKLVEEKRAILDKAQTARDKALLDAGLDVRPVVGRVTPVNLGAERPSPDRLRALKAAKLAELVKAEPPRESVTGSFRPH